jgi:hypothetical protein
MIVQSACALNTQYNYNDQGKEDEMDRASSTSGGEEERV